MKFYYKYSLNNHRINFKVWLERKINELKKVLNRNNIKSINTAIKTVTVVGCGHSGTSLVFGKLSRHQKIYTIGYETGWFFPTYNIEEAKHKLIEEIKTAKNINKSIVLEKTPKHIHSFKSIKTILPDNHFICLSRNPLDNIASLYRRFNNIENAIDRWNIDNKALLKYIKRNNCIILKYENLTLNPTKEFKFICDFLKINFDNDLLKSGKTAYNESKLKGNMLVRKNQVSKEIKPKINTWTDVFTIKEAKYIIEKTKPITSKLGYIYNENLKLDF